MIPLRSTLLRYCSMEAGGLKLGPLFWCRRGGIDLSNAYSVVPVWPHGFVFDRSIKQRNPVLLD